MSTRGWPAGRRQRSCMPRDPMRRGAGTTPRNTSDPCQYRKNAIRNEGPIATAIRRSAIIPGQQTDRPAEASAKTVELAVVIRCLYANTPGCDLDQFGRITSPLFHPLETSKSCINPQLLNRFNAFLIPDFLDYVYSAEILV